MDHPGNAPDGGPDKPVFRSLKRRRRSSGPPYELIGALVLLALAAGGAWYWFQSRSGDEAELSAPDTVEGAESEPVAEPEPPPIDLPELSESDTLTRELVGTLSSHPRLAQWLVTDDLVRRFVTAVVNIAAGGSPAEHVGFMAPEGSFEVQESGGRLLVDPASYERYDPIVEAFVSLDTEGAARLYRQLHPLFEEAYAELGIPDRTFDETMAVAVGNLLAVDVPDRPLEVEPDEAVYAYADPDLQALTPAEKHLLRLGPENARRVQFELSELAGAAGIAPGAGEGGEGS